MKRIAISGIITIVMFIVPSMALAHSGSVSCDATGVKFTYNANFASYKVSTERVGDQTYTFNVAPKVVQTHIVPLPTTSPVVVSASWGGPGSIPATTLSCPVTAPPVNVVVCPEGYVPQDAPNPVDYGHSYVVLCLRTVTVTNTNTVTVPVEVIRYVTTPNPPVQYKCPKGTKRVGFKSNILTCLKVKTKTVTRIVIREIPWKPNPPRHHTPGVTG